jgi:hypothetical protein
MPEMTRKSGNASTMKYRPCTPKTWVDPTGANEM